MSNSNNKKTYIHRSNIILTSRDYKGNGVYRKEFKHPIKFDSTKDRLSIESFQLYNSFYNIKKEYNNHQLKYTWINGESMIITFPDSYQSPEQFDFYIKQKLIEKNWFYYNKEKTDYLFCHDFDIISSIYSHRISLFYFPDQTLFTQRKFQKPDNVNWAVPNTKKHVKIELLGNLYKYFGTNTTIFPKPEDENGGTNLFYDSDFVPEVLIVDYINIHSNLIESQYNIESDYLTTVKIDSAFGDMITLKNNLEHKLNIKSGSYQFITIVIKDDSFNNIELIDSQMNINLIIESEKEI
jgi:hypothetical protein